LAGVHPAALSPDAGPLAELFFVFHVLPVQCNPRVMAPTYDAGLFFRVFLACIGLLMPRLPCFSLTNLALAGAVGMFACLAASPALAQQDVRVTDLKAFVFLERSGRLSADLLANPAANLRNIAFGQGEGGEPATGLIITVTLSGQKNTTPRYAAANVTITQTSRTGQKSLINRALEGFVFGEEGTVIRPLMIENATCQKIEVEVRTQRSSRKAALDFQCDEPKRPEPARRAPRS